nr:helix-turn-helix domain-containing protein [uncultured Jannaschia sp.]
MKRSTRQPVPRERGPSPPAQHSSGFCPDLRCGRGERQLSLRRRLTGPPIVEGPVRLIARLPALGFKTDAALPRHPREEVQRLRDKEGRCIAEIARLLDVSPNTVWRA